MISKTANVKYEKDEKKQKVKAVDKYTEIDFVQLVQVKIKIQNFFKSACHNVYKDVHFGFLGDK